jgi:hypothetical protein
MLAGGMPGGRHKEEKGKASPYHTMSFENSAKASSVKLNAAKMEHANFKAKELMFGSSQAGKLLDDMHRKWNGEYAALAPTWIKYMDGEARAKFPQAKAARDT